MSKFNSLSEMVLRNFPNGLDAAAEKEWLDGSPEDLKRALHVALCRRMINCAAQAKMPPGCSFHRHDTDIQQFEWDLKNVKFYGAGYADYHVVKADMNVVKFINELQKLNKQVEEEYSFLNVNVLDWLLDHKNLIPEHWKKMRVFFFGTSFRKDDNKIYAAYLYWDGKDWNKGLMPFDEHLSEDDYAIISMAA